MLDAADDALAELHRLIAAKKVSPTVLLNAVTNLNSTAAGLQDREAAGQVTSVVDEWLTELRER